LDERTPNHKKSFIQLAEAGYWDSLTLNRVIPNFVAQGGCPDTPAGFTDPEYLLAPEFHPELKHVYGALGAGRDDNPGKLSARCQFYIVQNPAGIPRMEIIPYLEESSKGWTSLTASYLFRETSKTSP
jgi:peptidyl-prolyl cis-trans isomerase B (cyclophilin B)